jgi:hypothetical protein
LFSRKAAFALTRRQATWLRWVLLCTLFSALHGLLGAWVLPAVASSPVTEICTPTGMQWVEVASAPGGDGPIDWPQGLAKPCAWASANVAVPPAMPGADRPDGSAWALAAVPLRAVQTGETMPSRAERVLLMAPMRAPPLEPRLLHRLHTFLFF